MSAFWSMFWFKPFQNFLRKIAIFRKFDHWSEILSMSAGRPLSQGVCPPLSSVQYHAACCLTVCSIPQGCSVTKQGASQLRRLQSSSLRCSYLIGATQLGWYRGSALVGCKAGQCSILFSARQSIEVLLTAHPAHLYCWQQKGRYPAHPNTAGCGKGYTPHVQTAGGGKNTPCTSIDGC